MKRFTAALVQMDTQDDLGENLAFMCEKIREAAIKGAQLVLFPEMSFYQGNKWLETAESIDGSSVELLGKAAAENKVYVLCGSFREKTEGKPYNTSLLIGKNGAVIARYRKNHMFDVELGDESYCESSQNSCGDQIVLANTELGCFGLSICYDLRFPEQFRLQALSGAQVLLLPASFMMGTGKDHWETLIRARAIENGCYVLAIDQIGKKKDGSTTYGRTMAVDPWGNVVAMAGDRPGIIFAEIDPEVVKQIRSRIPVLKNRRDDLYQLRTDHLIIYEEETQNP